MFELSPLLAASFVIGAIFIGLAFLLGSRLFKPRYRLVITRLNDLKVYQSQCRHKGTWLNVISLKSGPFLSLSIQSQFFTEADCLRNLTLFHEHIKVNGIDIKESDLPATNSPVDCEIRPIYLS